MRTIETTYFEKGGPEHTQKTLEAVKARAAELDVSAVVVTSTSGRTALEAGKTFSGMGLRVIAVPFQKNLYDRYGPPDPALVTQCRALGVEFIPEDPVKPMLDHQCPDIVNAWRTISQGFKVALQVASMCVDNGLLEAGSRVVSIGGSGTGADTAVVLETYGFNDILKSNVTEIIAMPVR